MGAMPSARGLRSRAFRTLAVGVAGVVAAAIAAGPALADPNLAAEWHLDALGGSGGQTATDSSGNGNDLSILTPGDVTVVPGRFQHAFMFDGSGRGNAAASQSLEAQQLTVLAWVKAGQSPGSFRYLIADGGSAGCNGSSYALDTGAGGGLEFYVESAQDAMAASPAALPSAVWDGNWHAVAGTYDGTTVRLYVDGTEVGSGTADGVAIGYQQDTQDLFMGDYPISSCPGHAYTGALDEARVYNRALTAAEVNSCRRALGTHHPSSVAELVVVVVAVAEVAALAAGAAGAAVASRSHLSCISSRTVRR
jgi:hypothetical protein